jgi:hypothetical protein
VSVSEASPIGQLVTTLVAVDGDLAGTPASTVRYAVESGDAGGHFALNRTSGVLVVRSRLDRETTTIFALNISATDGAPPFSQDFAIVLINVIDVNDNDPVFAPHNSTFYVAENEPGGLVVVNLTATDADDGLNGEVRYVLTAGAGSPQMFTVDVATGVLTTADALDRETQADYNLTVTAYDRGTPPRSTTTTIRVFVIDVNDNRPVFPILSYSSTIESVTAVGQVVVDRLEATDADGTCSHCDS